MTDTFNIKMTETLTGTKDGFTNELFKEGETYTVGASLFNSFKNMGACELVVVKKPVKKASPVKENKAIKAVKEVK